MAFRSSTASTPAGGSSVTTLSTAVPTGAAIGDIAVYSMYCETAATITGPSGFTLKSDLATGTPSTVGRMLVFYKRLSAADTGSYSATWTGAAWGEATCVLYSGRVASGDPFDGTPGTAQATGVTTAPAVNITPSVTACDLHYVATNFAGGNWTPVSTFTERYDGNPSAITLDTKDNVTTAATGSISAVCSGSGGSKAFVGAVLPAGAVADVLPILVMQTRRAF